MDAVNIVLCLCFLCFEFYMLSVALRRNGLVELRGKTNYLPLVAILLVSLLVLMPTETATRIELLRDALFYLALLSVLLVKRGFSERGAELLFTTVPWERIEAVRVEPYLTNKIRVRFFVNGRGLSVTFGRHRLQEVGDYLAARFPGLVVEGSLMKGGGSGK